MQGAVGVAGPRSRPLWLGALHDRREAARVEAEHGFGRLDDHAHLIVVLAAGETSPVRGRSHLDEQDRRLRQWRDLRHGLSQQRVHGFTLQGEDADAD